MPRDLNLKAPRFKIASGHNHKGSGTAPYRIEKVIGIAYDGERTEAEYFAGWRRVLGGAGVELRPFYVSSGGNALAAVQLTLKQRDPGLDEIWCICDSDDTSHQDLTRAVQLANANDIRLCVSTRSFEVWLALHWGKISLASITNEKEAISLLRKHYKPYSARRKSIPFEILFPLSKSACENAEWLVKQNVDNPATQVHEIVRILIEISRSN